MYRLQPVGMLLFLAGTVLLPRIDLAKNPEPQVSIRAETVRDLATLRDHLPKGIEGSLLEFGKRVCGPGIAAISPESSINLHLIWNRSVPTPVVCVSDFNSVFMQTAMEVLGAKVETTDQKLFEIPGTHPVFYQEVDGWMCFSPDREVLQEFHSPEFVNEQNQDFPVAIRVRLGDLSPGVKQEIVDVLTRRSLPPRISAPGDLAPDNLLHSYATRHLQELAEQGESLSIGFQFEPGNVTAVVDVQGEGLKDKHAGFAPLALPEYDDEHEGIAVRLDLKANEIAYLNWWSHSLADRAQVAQKEANILDRNGEEALMEAGRLLGRLLSNTVQQGVLEGFVRFNPNDEDESPLAGLRIQGGNAFNAELKTFMSSPVLADLDLLASEFDLDTIGETRIHRFTFADESNDDPVNLIVGISEHWVLVSVGSSGEDQIRDYLTDAADHESQSSPLRVAISGVRFKDLLSGYASSQETDSSARLDVQSEPTESGVRYTLTFVDAQNE